LPHQSRKTVVCVCVCCHLASFYSSNFTLCQKTGYLHYCNKKLQQSRNVQPFNVNILTEKMLYPLLRQMFKMLSLCIAWRYRLHLSAAFSKTACYTPNQTMLRHCCSSSFNARTHARTHTHTTVLRLSGFCTRRNIHPLTPIVVINHPLSTSSIYYDPWHPPCLLVLL